MRIPMWLKHYSVDEVIETAPIPSELHPTIVHALLSVAPKAYGDTPIPLSSVWNKLPLNIQTILADVDKALEKQYHDFCKHREWS